MTECSQSLFDFPACKSRKVQADFKGGRITSDGGALLLRQADRRIGLSKTLARALPDPRRQQSCDHKLSQLLRQRVYGIALGYEDLNDHQHLRYDPGLQTCAESDRELATASTLCRWENRADRQAAWVVHEWLLERFIQSFTHAPEELILDFDATDDPVHGKQDGRFFHGYYDSYCFLPLYVFCGSHLLVGYLRPSNIDPAKHAWAILSLLVKRLRQAWADVRIIIRADSGFCRWKLLRWCDRYDVGYIIGLAKNKRINRIALALMKEAREAFEETDEKQRLFTWVEYGARTWDRARRVIVKAEHTSMGSNPRYVVTSLEGDAQNLYEKVYCARGDMENRIKEQQLGLFSDRTSCSRWWPNQFRLLLSALAYVLIDTIRIIGLKATHLAKAQCTTIRLRLLKVGAVLLRNTRRVRFHLSSSYPYQKTFWLVAKRLAIE
jgi:hypothetical protein